VYRSKRIKNEEEDEYMTKASSSSITTRSRTTGTEVSGPRHAANTRTRGQNWSPDHLLSDPKSKLAYCNLSVIVLNVEELTAKELINKHTWEMLTPEDQAECMSHLPMFDIVSDKSNSDTTPSKPRVVDSFFEKNRALQDDMRTFQVIFTVNKSLQSRVILVTVGSRLLFFNARPVRARRD
jgi:hypothetical protein